MLKESRITIRRDRNQDSVAPDEVIDSEIETNNKNYADNMSLPTSFWSAVYNGTLLLQQKIIKQDVPSYGKDAWNDLRCNMTRGSIDYELYKEYLYCIKQDNGDFTHPT